MIVPPAGVSEDLGRIHHSMSKGIIADGGFMGKLVHVGWVLLL
jgi:hypothetical protein